MTLFAQNAAPLGKPYWWDEDLRYRNEGERLPQYFDNKESLDDLNVDILIVGAGYTGLSAAIVVADSGAKVLVVDQVNPGEGASTRNGGMFGAHPRLSLETLIKNYGDENGKGIWQEATHANDFARQLIANEQIDCDLQDNGRIQLAWTKRHHRNQKQIVENLTVHSQVKAKLISHDAMGEHINTRKYYGGVFFANHSHLNPARYHDGLMRAVLNRGVKIMPHCQVQSVDKTASGFNVATTKGNVKSQKILMATNGYTGDVFPWGDKRIFPLPSYVIATEPLDQELIKKIAPGNRSMVETRARHSYFRLSPDGTRILYGGRSAMKPIDLGLSAHRLHRTMCQVWPELKHTKLTHSWTGNTGYTFAHMPQVGQIDGVHYAMGYSGSGTVMAPYLGMKAAYQMLNDDKGKTAYSSTTLKSSFMYRGGTPHFLKLADFWYHNAVDIMENIEARFN